MRLGTWLALMSDPVLEKHRENTRGGCQPLAQKSSAVHRVARLAPGAWRS